MKKILLACMLMAASSAFSQNVISLSQLHTKSTVCMDGIMYFVGFSFPPNVAIGRYFISSVKIDPKTMLPQRCI